MVDHSSSAIASVQLRHPARGATLAITCAGQGPPLLLLHGTGTAGFSWDPLVARLASDFTCIVPDLPGHGSSSLPVSLDDCGLDGMASALVEVLHRLRLAPVAVVGHSAGAALGARLAQLAPDLVPRLCGVAPALWLSQNPRRQPGWPLVARLSRSRFLARLLSRAVSSPRAVARIAATTGSDLPPDQLARYTGLARNSRHLHAMLAMMAAWDLGPIQQAARTLTLPVLLVGGDRDPWFPPANVAFQASLFPHAVAETVREAGHFVHETHPDLVAARLRSFIAAP